MRGRLISIGKRWRLTTRADKKWNFEIKCINMVLDLEICSIERKLINDISSIHNKSMSLNE